MIKRKLGGAVCNFLRDEDKIVFEKEVLQGNCKDHFKFVERLVDIFLLLYLIFFTRE